MHRFGITMGALLAASACADEPSTLAGRDAGAADLIPSDAAPAPDGSTDSDATVPLDSGAEPDAAVRPDVGDAIPPCPRSADGELVLAVQRSVEVEFRVVVDGEPFVPERFQGYIAGSREDIDSEFRIMFRDEPRALVVPGLHQVQVVLTNCSTREPCGRFETTVDLQEGVVILEARTVELRIQPRHREGPEQLLGWTLFSAEDDEGFVGNATPGGPDDEVVLRVFPGDYRLAFFPWGPETLWDAYPAANLNTGPHSVIEDTVVAVDFGPYPTDVRVRGPAGFIPQLLDGGFDLLAVPRDRYTFPTRQAVGPDGTVRLWLPPQSYDLWIDPIRLDGFHRFRVTGPVVADAPQSFDAIFAAHGYRLTAEGTNDRSSVFMFRQEPGVGADESTVRRTVFLVDGTYDVSWGGYCVAGGRSCGRFRFAPGLRIEGGGDLALNVDARPLSLTVRDATGVPLPGSVTLRRTRPAPGERPLFAELDEAGRAEVTVPPGPLVVTFTPAPEPNLLGRVTLGEVDAGRGAHYDFTVRTQTIRGRLELDGQPLEFELAEPWRAPVVTPHFPEPSSGFQRRVASDGTFELTVLEDQPVELVYSPSLACAEPDSAELGACVAHRMTTCRP